MARLLDAVTPLADLLAHTPAPAAAADALRAACSDGADALAPTLLAHGVDGRLAALALAHAGMGSDVSAVDLAVRAGAVALLVEQHAEGDVELVFTVPTFLALPFEEFSTEQPSVHATRTAIAISDIAASATRSLVIAAPYLAAMAVSTLLSHVRRVLANGGSVTVITRALSPRAPEPSAANMEAIAAVRATANGTSGRLRVCSWEEDGLGVHLKAVTADATTAYLGSANLTPAGQLGHAEAGVHLPARLAAPLQAWLEMLADALARRRRPAAPW